MVGVVEEVGSAVTHVKSGDRVTVNVETFCGECFFCKKGFVNNCTDKNGGWALGCRIDGMLVKRPILVSSDFVLVGFKPEEWSAKLLK
jgi:threonine dehydrogenase-like Zn-dependent dehydrogenase